jgi:xylulokinase
VPLLLGIDIGTQGTKAALYTLEGRRLASSFRSSEPHRPSPGAVEEDPERQVASVIATIRECVRGSRADPKQVAGIAIVGQMAGVIGVGSDGRAVTPYDSWLDTRCAPYIGRMERRAGRRILARTGGPVSFNHGPKILWWREERRRMYRAIRAFVQPGGYAAMRLCGLNAASAFIDRTYLHFSGFADSQNGRWDPGLCRDFGIDAGKLPRIVEPNEVVGEVSGAMARRCGLRPGVRVIAGCGDTAASFLSCGATRAGLCVDVAGSASVFASVVGSFRPDVEERMLSCGRAAVPGLWHPYAYINGGGLNLKWFRDLVGLNGAGAAPATFAGLDRLAMRVPPASSDPLFVPHLGGRVAPAWPELRGAWANVTWAHGLPAFWRSILESVALEYALYWRAIRELHPSLRPTELRVTGGGAQSGLWNQIKADVLGLRVVGIARSEGAPTGAALLAAHGAGLLKDLDSGARRWIATTAEAKPNRRLAAHYRARIERYAALLETLKTASGPFSHA